MSEPTGIRVLQLDLKSALTGETHRSRIKIELPSARYASHLKQK